MKNQEQEHMSGADGCHEDRQECRQHTPGPWHTQSEQHREWIIGSDGLPVGYRWRLDRFPRDNVANARLIASAPELLAALQIIHANAGESAEWIRRHASAAIALATGGAK